MQQFPGVKTALDEIHAFEKNHMVVHFWPEVPGNCCCFFVEIIFRFHFYGHWFFGLYQLFPSLIYFLKKNIPVITEIPQQKQRPDVLFSFQRIGGQEKNGEGEIRSSHAAIGVGLLALEWEGWGLGIGVKQIENMWVQWKKTLVVFRRFCWGWKTSRGIQRDYIV